MGLGAASAAPLAKVGRIEFPRDMKQHGPPQPAARASHDMINASQFRSPRLCCFRMHITVAFYTAKNGGPWPPSRF